MYEGVRARHEVDEGRVYMSTKRRLFAWTESGRYSGMSMCGGDQRAGSDVGYAGSVLVQSNLLILNVGSHGGVDKTTAHRWSSGADQCGIRARRIQFHGIPSVVIISARLFLSGCQNGHALFSRPWKTEYD